MTLGIVDQIKTAQGRIPVKSACTSGPKDDPRKRSIVFELAPPQLLDGASAEAAFGAGEELKIGLEDLSVVMQGDCVREEDVIAFANASGPLFGRGDRESVSDWLNAITVARSVVAVQEVLNGSKPFEAARQWFPEKSSVEIAQTGEAFDIFCLALALGSGEGSLYECLMPSFPLLKKFRSSETHDYAFAATERDGDAVILYVLLLSFEHEISAADFAAAVAYFMEDESIAEQARSLYENESPNAGQLGLLSGESDLVVRDAPIGECDYPHVQRLLYALISLHLDGVRIDVFNSSEGDDFMVFGSYLAYLWYGFAKRLGKVRIGYCAQCGKGFSLTRHRGIKRRFCSEACKTKEKNERMRKLRDDVRAAFAEGKPIDAIAHEFFGSDDEASGRRRAIAQLRGWKELQHDIDAAILLRGERRDLLKRCLDEGVLSEEDLAARVRAIQSDVRLRREVAKRAGVR